MLPEGIRKLAYLCRIEEIFKIHNELQKLYYKGLNKAIRLGELLEEQKEDLKHGEFEGWAKPKEASQVAKEMDKIVRELKV